MKNMASGENNFGDIREELYLLNLVFLINYVNPQIRAGEFFSI